MFSFRVDEYNALAVPFGVVFLLPFVPVFWLLPPRWLRAGIIVMSVALAVLTWPWQWCVTLGLVVLYGYLIIAVCQARAGPADRDPEASKSWVRFAWSAVLIAYVPALIWPKFQWLPAEPAVVQHPYYWVAWLGLAYLSIRILHVAIDVVHGKLTRVRFVDYVAYAIFAPILRMGPIMRFGDFVSQLETWPQRLTRRDVGIGLARIALGLLRMGLMLFLMNEVIADGFRESPQHFGWSVVLISAAVSPFTIYLWVCGYADIAIGLGRMMGFVIPENYVWPWQSTDIRAFWRRLHMTMGSWLFEYVYIPLGGNRRHVFVNYLVTFVLCAVWHGFIVSYFVWGSAQAVGLYVNRLWRQYWTAQREAQTRMYRMLLRCHLVGGRLSRVLGWALTCGYAMLTISIFMDERYAGARWLGYLLGLYDG